MSFFQYARTFTRKFRKSPAQRNLSDSTRTQIEQCSRNDLKHRATVQQMAIEQSSDSPTTPLDWEMFKRARIHQESKDKATGGQEVKAELGL